MNKIIIYSIFGFIICSAFKPEEINKKENSLTDYRDLYTGTYACKSYRSHLSSENHNRYILDTGRVKIILTKDALDSVIQVQIGNQVLKTKLVNGGLRSYPTVGKFGGRFFSSDSLDFFVMPNRASSERYMGEKN
jgi:hypothetical protein